LTVCCFVGWLAAGEEQAKVEVLTSRLEELGEDVDKLLEAVAAADDDAEQDEGHAQQEDGDLL
jgi:outer membrane murein-binding lipoprotein Lpp